MSIYSAAIKVEGIFKRQYDHRDPTLTQLNYVSANRIDKLKAFKKWQRYNLIMRSKPQKAEFSKFANILIKIQRNKLARRFMYWKYVCKVNDE